jgi:hypothetical protein
MVAKLADGRQELNIAVASHGDVHPDIKGAGALGRRETKLRHCRGEIIGAVVVIAINAQELYRYRSQAAMMVSCTPGAPST